MPENILRIHAFPRVSYSLVDTARFLSLRTKIFVAGDENLLCAGNTYKRLSSLTTIFNIIYARNYFSSLTTEGKISVASEKKSCRVR